MPWRRRQGQSAHRRAEPHRRDLALWWLGGHRHRDHQQGAWRGRGDHPHAGAQGLARCGKDSALDRVRLESVQREGRRGAVGLPAAARSVARIPRRRAPIRVNDTVPDRMASADLPTEELALYEIRKKIYPRAVHGWFAGWRWGMVLLTQAIFYGLPWLSWNGRQAVLFDLGARKFYIFGLVFWPQDVIYLTVLLILSALALFLFTAVAGRLWCGYACPQTVYTEIFTWIERKIEGDRLSRIRLDAAPLSLRKLGIKALKHGIWFAVALWTGYSFV